MSQPYLGQLSLVGFSFAPTGWQLAQGQLLPISLYSALFSLLGTYYGGNGTNNFQLPNMQGNVPIGYGQGAGLSDYVIGETSGTQTVTVLSNQAPIHTHAPSGKNFAGKAGDGPAGNSFADSASGSVYSTSTPTTQMSPAAISTVGGNQPHNNMMPYLGMYWVIAFNGIYPARS
jgi:microcystin-dependent protein